MKEKNWITLHLKKKWFDMIWDGEKKEEYREIKPYWIKRLCVYWNDGECMSKEEETGCKDCQECFYKRFLRWECHQYKYVKLYLGYTKTFLIYKVDKVTYGRGKKEWGAPEGKDVFRIELGQRLLGNIE